MTTQQIESRAAAYLDKLPHAVSGEAGHRTTFAAACRLVEFGLPFDRALPLLAAWNVTHCQPRWTEAALHHKLSDAFKRTTPKQAYTQGQRGNVTRRATPRPARPQPSATAKSDSAQLAATIKILLRSSKSRPAPASQSALPAAVESFVRHLEFQSELRDMKTLAQMRGISFTAVMNAFARGLIRFSNHNRKPSWFVLDRSFRVASARRMDGGPWFEGTASECKAVMLRGSQAKWPIGIREAQDYPTILLCEGAPDLLAVFHAILGRSEKIAPVAMLSAACPIHTDALRLFTGKRVRIYAHNDGGTGERAAAKWVEQIKSRATVDVFSLAPYRVKDLNDYVRANYPAENLFK